MKPPSLYELMMATPRPLRKFVRHRIMSKNIGDRLEVVIHRGRKRSDADADTQPSVLELTKKLWGGYSEQSLSELEEILVNPETSGLLAAQAARAISCWHASRGDFEQGYRYAFLARLAHRGSRNKPQQVNLEVDCLMAMGRRDEARRRIENALKRDPTHVGFRMSYANTFAHHDGPGSDEEDETRLQIINEIFTECGLSSLDRIDRTRPLTLSNIHCPDAKPLVEEARRAKITVLMPAYSALDTLEFAVDSLLRQTWWNLEVIIIDDQSPDETFQLAQRLAEKDSRIRALQQEKNSGAYAARNLGLEYASGDFVTVHDADDWSHPEKLALQVRHLLDHPREVANLTDWARSFAHLFFRGSARVGPSRVIQNHSSLMIRRDTLVGLGGWDQVRIAADSELIRRLEGFTQSEIPRIMKGIPLAFSLELASSLTRQGLTHVFTIYHGVRRTYHEAGRHWIKHHAQAAGWRIPAPHEGRAFPAPRIITPHSDEAHAFDLLIVMDFALAGGAFVSTMNYVQAALETGARVAVFQQRRHDQKNVNPPQESLMHLVHEGLIYRVSPGESIQAKTVLVGYPVILGAKLDLPPLVECERVALITNQMPARLYSGGDVQYDPSAIEQYVKDTYGLKPVWIPISDLVRSLMEKDGRFSCIYPHTWTPLIDTRGWGKRRVKYRGQEGKRPIIGRHARDHATKWPSDANQLRAAYCANTAIDVRLLGGGSVPHEILGNLPRNWAVYPYGHMSSLDFLEQLDFFIHYPHEDYIEEFGRSVIEAMALGLPVILPPVFRVTFGEAAIYAEPDQVAATVLRIWSDQATWEQRSRAGLSFVETNSDWSAMKERLETLQHWFPPSEE